jgi:hypothetical protein
MDKLKRDINLFLCINHHRNHTQDDNNKQEIIYNGHKIYYSSYRNKFNDNHTIFINGGRRPCFVLSVEGTVGTLQSLERGSDCFVDRHDNSKDLVMSAFQIAKSKGCTNFELTDNSFKSCLPYRFNLSNVYFLTKGVTWYESILPLKIKSWSEEKLNKYRQNVKNTKWTTIAKYLLEAGANLDFVSTEGVELNKHGSAMIILNRIKEMKNDISCQFFAKYTGEILIASKIETFHGTTWIFTP